MTIKFHQSILFKMTLLVLGGTSIVFGLVLYYSYTNSRQIILTEAEKTARNLSLSVARRLEQEFRGMAKVPENLARVLEIRPGNDKARLDRLIALLVKSNEEVFGSTVAFEPYMFDPELRSYAPYFYKTELGLGFEQLAATSYIYFQRDWYHIPIVLRAPIWTEPYYDVGGGEILMATYSVPFFKLEPGGKRGKVEGIVTADISLEWLTKRVSSVQVARSGFCFIVSGSGTFVTHPRESFVMRESIFSIAEELHEPRLRNIGRAMIRERAGFVRVNSVMTGGEAFLAYARIRSPQWSLAAVFPRDELLADLAQLQKEIVILAVIGVALLLGVSILVARSIARPLVRMADATRQVARGDLDIDLSDIRVHDEVGELARAFSRMTEGLKDRDFIRDTFGRYVTREVANSLLANKDALKLGGEQREITLIMSDLRGFTALTSNMTPEDVISFLNRYLGKMVEIMLSYRGVIDEIIGDGMLAFFGAPEPLEDHPARAVACAVKMQAAMDEINARNEADGLPHLEMGIAVHTGSVVVGNIGHSELRQKYGAVGSDVNFTGRMESYTVGGQVLISKATFDKISDLAEIKKTVEVRMKGIPEKVPLYDVISIGGEYDVRIPQREETDPVALELHIPVLLHRMTAKVTRETKTAEAQITRLSRAAGVVALTQAIKQWEDVRIQVLDENMQPTPGEIYGKVLEVQVADEQYLATVRFTSFSPEVYGLLMHKAFGDSKIT